MIFGACPEAPIANSCAALRLRTRPNMRFVLFVTVAVLFDAVLPHLVLSTVGPVALEGT
jgi:hypothetical protein